MPKARMTTEKRELLESLLAAMNHGTPLPTLPDSRQQGSLTLNGVALNLARAIFEPLPYAHLPVDERPDNIDYGDDPMLRLRHLARAYDFSQILDLLKFLEGTEPERFKVCARPGCPVLFYAYKGDREVCSKRCGVAYWQELRRHPERRELYNAKQKKTRRKARDKDTIKPKTRPKTKRGKCVCGHVEGKHFAATKGSDAGCEGNGHTCECSGFFSQE
jgi:hypothetical protein